MFASHRGAHGKRAEVLDSEFSQKILLALNGMTFSAFALMPSTVTLEQRPGSCCIELTLLLQVLLLAS